jgi:hypothetical protein
MLSTNKISHEKPEQSGSISISTANSSNNDNTPLIVTRSSANNESSNATNQASQQKEIISDQQAENRAKEAMPINSGEYVPTFSELERKKLDEQLRNVSFVRVIKVQIYQILNHLLFHKACSIVDADLSGVLLLP